MYLYIQLVLNMLSEWLLYYMSCCTVTVPQHKYKMNVGYSTPSLVPRLSLFFFQLYTCLKVCRVELSNTK